MEFEAFASKYSDWENKYNWDTCKVNRKEYGQFLCSFLTNNSQVINLDGDYGSGKTEFIRRLYIDLARKMHPVVYIDIWESDFSNNPLSVICSELLQQIEFVLGDKTSNCEGNEIIEAKKKINALKSNFSKCIKYVQYGAVILGDTESAASAKAMSNFTDATPDLDIKSQSEQLIDLVKNDHIEAVKAVKDIKELITDITGLIEIIYDLKIPIIILIDELDRCRPSYAIEVLEVIKHFFDTEGCTFLVATNTNVLEHSIRAIYGQAFDSKQYLRRFFDRKINLPSISTYDYLVSKNLNLSKYNSNNFKTFPFNNHDEECYQCFAELFEANGLTLRDIDQVLNRFTASLDYLTEIKSHLCTYLNVVVLICGLIEQHLDASSLSERNNKSDNFKPSIQTGTEHNTQLVNKMFESVTLICAIMEYRNSTKGIKHMEPCLMLRIQNNSFKDSLLFAKRDDPESKEVLPELVNGYKKSSCNYLLWDDYKKVILLSGEIDY